VKSNTISVGGVQFTGHPGCHVLVTVRGPGPEGHRPLLGHFALTLDEWDALVDAAAQLTTDTAQDNTEDDEETE